GTLDIKLALPERPNRQTPHEQDEVYVVIRGRGFLFHDGRRDPFETGDLLFVAAGVDHRFEDASEDLTVWRIFYGPRGGEVAAERPRPALRAPRSQLHFAICCLRLPGEWGRELS